jgi:hypothetical protein
VVFLRIIDEACKVIVGLAILVMVVSIFGQVFYRTVLDSFLGWAEEAARFSSGDVIWRSISFRSFSAPRGASCSTPSSAPSFSR